MEDNPCVNMVNTKKGLENNGIPNQWLSLDSRQMEQKGEISRRYRYVIEIPHCINTIQW